ncbi:hypothetical protein DSO57_1014886 [Entomophthora muscae]|uniref:Uncharacterized protein n=2 Tax=Entomophthora muscae TaxID=34485 RepID=A0ACC2TSG6_9FUNG|nr:hypothetical protein DSO57_1014882 [Entomophthora muscae]KAJ9077648.1 hypothetical protein DSO57_1014886 [Entomophthora muscae]
MGAIVSPLFPLELALEPEIVSLGFPAFVLFPPEMPLPSEPASPGFPAFVLFPPGLPLPPNTSSPGFPAFVLFPPELPLPPDPASPLLLEDLSCGIAVLLDVDLLLRLGYCSKVFLWMA